MEQSRGESYDWLMSQFAAESERIATTRPPMSGEHFKILNRAMAERLSDEAIVEAKLMLKRFTFSSEAEAAVVVLTLEQSARRAAAEEDARRTTKATFRATVLGLILSAVAAITGVIALAHR